MTLITTAANGTTFRFRRYSPNVLTCQMVAADGLGGWWIIVGVPGGIPRLCSDPYYAGAITTGIVNAPHCDGLRDFRAFVLDRFGRP